MAEFDTIIVGGGSAGCVLAARLSEDPAHQVLLLEAGGEDTNPLITMPLGFLRAMTLPQLNWRYLTEPEPHFEWPANADAARQSAWRIGQASTACSRCAAIRTTTTSGHKWARAGGAMPIACPISASWRTAGAAKANITAPAARW